MAGAARFDHLAFAASDLAAGVSWLELATGATLPKGGVHPAMGTHNHVAAIGRDSYVEVIAIDPDAVAPERPRWFGLDQPEVRAALAQGPRLHTWVAAVPDLDAALRAAAAIGIDYGQGVAMTRGALNWRFAMTDDGAMPLSGAAPQLIEWPAGPHVAAGMHDLGLRLGGLRIETPAAALLGRLLAVLGLDDDRLDLVQTDEPDPATRLSAELITGEGRSITLGHAAPTVTEPV